MHAASVCNHEVLMYVSKNQSSELYSRGSDTEFTKSGADILLSMSARSINMN